MLESPMVSDGEVSYLFDMTKSIDSLNVMQADKSSRRSRSITLSGCLFEVCCSSHVSRHLFVFAC